MKWAWTTRPCAASWASPKGHPLHKVQNLAEWEEVGKVSHKLALPLAKLLQRLEV